MTKQRLLHFLYCDMGEQLSLTVLPFLLPIFLWGLEDFRHVSALLLSYNPSPHFLHLKMRLIILTYRANED